MLDIPGRAFAWVAFFARLLVGLQFGMAGYFKVFVLGAPNHAQNLFVAPYADSWIPAWLLFATGLAIPFVELIGGWLLILGWRRRTTAIVFGFLLVLVTYGHLLAEPFYDISVHVLPRFLLLIPVLVFDESVDRWSVDGWRARSPGKQKD